MGREVLQVILCKYLLGLGGRCGARRERYGDGLASRSEEIGRRASAFNGNVFADLCLRGEERPMKVKSRTTRWMAGGY